MLSCNISGNKSGYIYLISTYLIPLTVPYSNIMFSCMPAKLIEGLSLDNMINKIGNIYLC